jgi:hypothetical protein
MTTTMSGEAAGDGEAPGAGLAAATGEGGGPFSVTTTPLKYCRSQATVLASLPPE